MYSERFFEETPTGRDFREIFRSVGREEGLQEGRKEGLQKGLQVLQDLLVSSVQTRHPDLAELAQQQAGHFDQLETLKILIQQIMAAPNDATVHTLLESGPTKS